MLAMGAEPKKLGVPGEDELAARGVSYCATCDAAFFRDHETIVVGGGDTAMEDATFLAKFAGKVDIVHRRPEFRASAIMLQRAKDEDNIELVTPYVVQSFKAGESGVASKAVLENTEDGSTKEIEITGAFIAIGHRPNSQLVADQLDLDDEGYVLVEGRSTRTKLPGVFAAGDLTDHVYRQAVTAAGTGCMAALDAEAYLRDTRSTPEAHWAPDPTKVEAAASRPPRSPRAPLPWPFAGAGSPAGARRRARCRRCRSGRRSPSRSSTRSARAARYSCACSSPRWCWRAVAAAGLGAQPERADGWCCCSELSLAGMNSASTRRSTASRWASRSRSSSSGRSTSRCSARAGRSTWPGRRWPRPASCCCRTSAAADSTGWASHSR